MMGLYIASLAIFNASIVVIHALGDSKDERNRSPLRRLP
jgi:hypothetical protein